MPLVKSKLTDNLKTEKSLSKILFSLTEQLLITLFPARLHVCGVERVGDEERRPADRLQ